MPSSHHLILCCPLLLLPPIPPSIRVFSNESTLHMRWPKDWSFSVSIIPSKEIPGLISFRMDWLDLPCSPRDSQESPPTPQFKSINSSALSLLHSPTLTSILRVSDDNSVKVLLKGELKREREDAQGRRLGMALRICLPVRRGLPFPNPLQFGLSLIIRFPSGKREPVTTLQVPF